MGSDSDEEDFVIYGTSLEPLEEDAVPKKRAFTVEDQVAKDKHGRRRFHGAFTGGFSAGFFNTVGSLEGWKPSQFMSSRSSKSKAHMQRAEDFMDEEDMDEFGIAPKMIRPTSDYDQNSEGTNKKRSMMQYSDSPIPGIPVLRSLVEPVRETIGIRLLMKMGWKPGQGVGPRLSKLEKLASKNMHKKKKLYGCALPNQENEESKESEEEMDEDVEFDPEVTFAPDDFEPYIVKPKDDCFGLGYSGLDRRPVLSTHVSLFEPACSSLVMQEKKKKVSIRGQAFGVGAFEKEDDDIYAAEDMSQYDFALDTPQMLAEKRKQEKIARSAHPSSLSDTVEGFVVSSCPVVRKRYSPPRLPEGYIPHHQTRQSRFSAGIQATSQVHTRLSATERAVLVNSELPQPPPPVAPLPEEKEIVNVERASCGTFRPFVADPDKQERYEKFLTLSKQQQSDKLSSLQPLTMTEWERDRERAEFEQAARLYRPLSAAFSDRFVSASHPDSATDPLEPLPRTYTADEDVRKAAKLKMFGPLTRKISEWTPHSILCKRFNIPQPRVSSSVPVKASRPKFSVFNFLDAAPFNTTTASSTTSISSETVEIATSMTNPIVTPTTSVSATTSSASLTPTSTVSTSLSSLTPAIADTSETGETTSKKDSIEELVDSTNKMDLYKAIFLSSSDESDAEDENSERPPATLVDVTKQQTASELNVLRNTSPPRGIFANLDLDKLKTQGNKSSVTPQEKTVEEINLQNTSPPRGIFSNLNTSTMKNLHSENNSQSQQLMKPQLEDSSVYGPSLPNNMARPQPTLNQVKEDESSTSGGEWVEMNDSSDEAKKSKKKHKKSHRKSKKHKEKKHKHKKNRK